MSAGSLTTQTKVEERCIQQRAIAEAVRNDLAGAWIAVQPRRRSAEVQLVVSNATDREKDQPPDV